MSAVKEDITVSIEEFASPNKSRQAFDSDLASHGILPILVTIANNGTPSYRIRQIDITAKLKEENLQTIYADKAASDAATNEYVGKALGWTVATGPLFVLFWPVTIAGSAAHTAGVNRRIEQHFASMEFTDKLLKSNQRAAGFVYLRLPHRNKTIEPIVVSVKVREEENGDSIDFSLMLPALDLASAPAAANN